MRSADKIVRLMTLEWEELSADERLEYALVCVESFVTRLAARSACGLMRLAGHVFEVADPTIEKLRALGYIVDVEERTDSDIVIHLVWDKNRHRHVENRAPFGKPAGHA